MLRYETILSLKFCTFGVGLLQCSNGLILAAKFGYLDENVDKDLACGSSTIGRMWTKDQIERMSGEQVMDLVKSNLLDDFVVQNVSTSTLFINYTAI